MSTVDISGGSSGSPLLNEDLEVVGVVFDSNMEALPNEYLYRDQSARAVAVDAQASWRHSERCTTPTVSSRNSRPTSRPRGARKTDHCASVAVGDEIAHAGGPSIRMLSVRRIGSASALGAPLGQVGEAVDARRFVRNCSQDRLRMSTPGGTGPVVVSPFLGLDPGSTTTSPPSAMLKAGVRAREDSNPRHSAPKADALSRLSYRPVLSSSSIHASITLDPRIFAVRPLRRTETHEHDALGGPRNVPTLSHRAGGNLRMR